jgi:putative oligomerization/nucleic acid binding protein/phospholipase D-like protein
MTRHLLVPSGRRFTHVIATEWNLGSVFWAMLVFFFWFMAIWIFITIFADIFRRRDLGGWAKAGWVLLIFVVPFLGALIYMIARPKMTEQDKEDMERMQEAQRRSQGYSSADEIAKLAKLRDEGKITADEYEEMKRKAMMPV